jgi:pyruvate dehydrogenase E1 component beta subunit
MTMMTAAIQRALREEMARDDRVFVMGIDVEIGLTGRTKGLATEFGAERVRDTPISEAGFLGAGIGAAAAGMVPIVDLMMSNFIYVAMDQIANNAAKLRYMLNGSADFPMTIISSGGAPGGCAAQHSDAPWGQVINMGLKTVLPSTAEDAYGLLKAAIRDPNPVMFFVHFALGSVRGELPEHPEAIPLGKARTLRDGTDVTLVAWGMMAQRSMAAAVQLEQEGVSIEVIDPRTLHPFDWEAVADSVAKTGRLVVVDEARRSCSLGSEVVARMAVEHFDALRVAPRLIANPDLHIPYAPILEREVVPQVEDIINGVMSVMHRVGQR